MGKFIEAFLLTLVVLVLVFLVGVLYVGASVHYQGPLDLVTDLTTNRRDSLDSLLIGVDSRDRSQDNPWSDVMMLVHLNETSKSISLISIPRDIRTKIEGRKYKRRINHAFACGEPDLFLRTVNQLLGTQIPYYMVIGYEFVKDMVDTMGGVQVDIPIEMNYGDTTVGNSLIIHFKPGLQTLNGEDAVKSLRLRKGYKNADPGRVQAQQQFIGAFLRELKKLEQWVKVPVFLAKYQDNADSTIPLSVLIQMSPILTQMGEDGLQSAILLGSPRMTDHLPYFILDEDQARNLLAAQGIL